MLVLTQLAVGAFVVDLVAPSGGQPSALRRRRGRWPSALVALGASVLHLGRPRYAYRAVLGLRHSWLSREVVAFGAFAAAGRRRTRRAACSARARRSLGWAAAGSSAWRARCDLRHARTASWRPRWWRVRRHRGRVRRWPPCLGVALVVAAPAVDGSRRWRRAGDARAAVARSRSRHRWRRRRPVSAHRSPVDGDPAARRWRLRTWWRARGSSSCCWRADAHRRWPSPASRRRPGRRAARALAVLHRRQPAMPVSAALTPAPARRCSPRELVRARRAASASARCPRGSSPTPPPRWSAGSARPAARSTSTSATARPSTSRPTTDYPVNLGHGLPEGLGGADAAAGARPRDHAAAARRPTAGSQPVDWDDGARRRSPTRFKAIQAEHGPESVAFLSHRPDPDRGDGAARRARQVRHGHASTATATPASAWPPSVVAYKQAFGFDAPPYTYADFEESDVIVLVGSNLCIAHPILWERVCRNPHQPEIVVVDPAHDRDGDGRHAAPARCARSPTSSCSTAWPTCSSRDGLDRPRLRRRAHDRLRRLRRARRSASRPSGCAEATGLAASSSSSALAAHDRTAASGSRSGGRWA